MKAGTLAAAGAAAAPFNVLSDVSPNRRIGLAAIGLGNIGMRNLMAAAKEPNVDVVALCDVNWTRHVPRMFQQFPKAQPYKDYRKMFDEMGRDIDAVIVAIPDHSHFGAAMRAIDGGAALYVQKPLTHTVDQARRLTRAAREAGVITQMGNQGHSSPHIRNLKEWVQAGVLGDVVKVQCWTMHPNKIWTQGMTEYLPPQDIPETMDWDLWLGPAPEVAYNSGYTPMKWRGWYNFGGGGLGDQGCHVMDPANYALDLEPPVKIEVSASGESPVAYPAHSVVTYHFRAREGRPAFTLEWWDGQKDGRHNQPPPPPEWEEGREMPDHGFFIHGTQASVTGGQYGGGTRIFPETKFAEMKSSLPPQTLPRVKGNHIQDWLNGIVHDTPPCSNFDYAGPFTEIVMLGAIAQRLNRTLDFDPDQGIFIGDEQANRLIEGYAPRGGFNY